MRLLIFIHSLRGGGAERVTANLANYWAGRKWDVVIVTLSPQTEDFYELHHDVKRIALDLAGNSSSMLSGLTGNFRRLVALRRVLRQFNPDIALGMMTTANVLLALATWGLPRLCAIGSERTHPPQYPLGVLWESLRRFAYGRLAAVVALTHESAYWLEANTHARRVVVIPNAANWPLPNQAPRISCEASQRPGKHILLAVGRTSEEKQFDLLIEVFAGLAQRYPGWNLVILGDGPLRSLLLDQVHMAGLGDRVFLPGRAGNVGEWYEHADLYVMSSRFEGFPNTLAEAMAYGLPAVSFDCDTGPRDIVRHGVDGLLVPPGDKTALAGVLDRMMGDADLRRRFAGRAVEIRDRFSMERVSGMWESLFLEMVNERK